MRHATACLTWSRNICARSFWNSTTRPMAATRRLAVYRKHLIPASPWSLGRNVPCVRPMTTAADAGGAATVLQTRTSIPILDSFMSYLDTGVQGNDTVIFLHGNPTSAYLWRNIMPHVRPIARCLAPDLIGMGHSGKLADHDYTYENHYRYLCAWLDKMALPEKVTIVCHDWGSGLGLHWCHMNKERVRSIVFMEAVASVVPSWDFFPEVARGIFQALRSDAGEDLVLEKNFFVERLLPGSIMRTLTDEEMAEYVRPFKEPGESRRPTLTWPREIPIATDGPQNVVDKVDAYNKWLSTSSGVPKLYIDGEPGFFSPGIRRLVASWPNLKTVKVKGLHFLQEDSPDEIGQAIVEFLQNLGRP